MQMRRLTKRVRFLGCAGGAEAFGAFCDENGEFPKKCGSHHVLPTNNVRL
jgi:hypothetical protein